MNELFEKLMGMGVGEGRLVGDDYAIRVPGGWVYAVSQGPGVYISCCFIPMSEAKKELEQPHD